MTTNNNDSLDDWRSSHIIGDITSESAGQDVILMGWVESIRKQGGIIFLILKDRSSSIQIILKKGKSSDDLLDKLDGITDHSSIGVKGNISINQRAPGGIEIIPSAINRGDIFLIRIITSFIIPSFPQPIDTPD